jgi:hypothetical protein
LFGAALSAAIVRWPRGGRRWARRAPARSRGILPFVRIANEQCRWRNVSSTPHWPRVRSGGTARAALGDTLHPDRHHVQWRHGLRLRVVGFASPAAYQEETCPGPSLGKIGRCSVWTPRQHRASVNSMTSGNGAGGNRRYPTTLRRAGAATGRVGGGVMHAIRNARITLLATALNNLGVGAIIAPIVAPMVDGTVGIWPISHHGSY